MRHMVSIANATWEVTPYSGENGCYCAVQPNTLSLLRLIELCNDLGIVSDPRKFHCTVMYSPEKAPKDLHSEYDMEASAQIVGLQWWPGHNNAGYLSAELYSPKLEKHHNSLLDMGAEHTFSPYNPHVTLMKGVQLTGGLEARFHTLNRSLLDNPIPVVFDISVVSDIKD